MIKSVEIRNDSERPKKIEISARKSLSKEAILEFCNENFAQKDKWVRIEFIENSTEFLDRAIYEVFSGAPKQDKVSTVPNTNQSVPKTEEKPN